MISVNIYEADYQVIENISLRQNGIYSDKKILVTFCAFCSRNSLKHNYNIKTQYVENRKIFYIKIYLIRGQMYLMIDICEFILMKSVPQDRIKHLIKF